MTPIPASPRRRWLVPEVVQTSAMDCGPAALTSLLGGYGIPLSYGRLREACQTNVDGTSIDTLEEAAVQLGLEAEQVMAPVDHVLLPEAAVLPALVVVRLANGCTHFVVAWRRHGPLVQVMDPATGRRWPACRAFLRELYVHSQPLPVATWRAWAGTDEFLGALQRRWALLGLASPAVERHLARALDDPDWHPLALLDATTRMLEAMVHAGGCRRGHTARRLFVACYERALASGVNASSSVPAMYWTVQSAPPADADEPLLTFRGAVLLRVRGRHRLDTATPTGAASGPVPLAPELAAALTAPPLAPGRTLWRLLWADGCGTPVALGAMLALTALGVVSEALLVRGLVDLGRELGLLSQRLGAMAAWLLFMAVLLGLELPTMAGLLRLGRRLETRLRLAFLTKIPRLGDRYFQSRPTSDMAERSHAVHQVRLTPVLGGQAMRLLCEVLLVTAGLLWLAPASAPLVLLMAMGTVGLPLVVHPLMTERDLRLRTHTGALGRFYLDALLGLVAVRTHGAERAIRREYESLLVAWAGAGTALQHAAVMAEGLQTLLGFGGAAWLLGAYVRGGGEASGMLLLAYWALSLPGLGQEIALLVRQYPRQRNVTLRLLEPLGALEDAPHTDAAVASPGAATTAGVAITLEQVSVRAAGQTILTDLDLTIPAGSHVAIVGPSGAGKSSLVGLLLGWHRAASGQVRVDGLPLAGQRLAQLRQETAWVDPTVQVWNRSLLANLRYGLHDADALPLPTVIEQAELRRLLDTLPDGLQTALGEGGRLVSGGEGQRVRLARALLRPGVRLVILDEPFRGLDHVQRSALLARARHLWQTATLLCITHDVRATQDFARVLVVDGGRLVEDGAPAVLAAQPDSRYRALLATDVLVHERLWTGDVWRRLRLDRGRVVEDKAPGGP